MPDKYYYIPLSNKADWELKVDTTMAKGILISYHKVRGMIIKGFIYHIVCVHDIALEPPTLQYNLIVMGF